MSPELQRRVEQLGTDLATMSASDRLALAEGIANLFVTHLPANMEEPCPVDVPSAESGSESAPPAPPTPQELSLIRLVGELAQELKAMNHALLEICSANSIMLNALAETLDEEADEAGDGKYRYLDERE